MLSYDCNIGMADFILSIWNGNKSSLAEKQVTRIIWEIVVVLQCDSFWCEGNCKDSPLGKAVRVCPLIGSSNSIRIHSTERSGYKNSWGSGKV